MDAHRLIPVWIPKATLGRRPWFIDEQILRHLARTPRRRADRLALSVLEAIKPGGIVDQDFADHGGVAGAGDELLEQRRGVETAIDDRRGLRALGVAVAAGVRPIGPPDAAVGIDLDERTDDRAGIGKAARWKSRRP